MGLGREVAVSSPQRGALLNTNRNSPHGIGRGILFWLLLLGLARAINAGDVSFGQNTQGSSNSYARRAVSAPAGGKKVLLSTVVQARSLTPEEAAKSIPIRLRGVVTAMPGYKNSFFFQDATAGISVDRTDEADVHVGDRVQVIGVTGPGLFAPVALASEVKVLGRGDAPVAPRRTLGDLFGGLEDSQWIELRGVVRTSHASVLFGRPIMELALALDGGQVNLLIQGPVPAGLGSLVDSVVRVRGVCASSGNDKRQFVGSALLVPHWKDLIVEGMAPSDTFAVPSHGIGDILKLGQWLHRVRVQGVVTYQVPGQAIYLQDGNDGIRVNTESKEIVELGARVEAVGFPGMGEYAPVLEDGAYRKLSDARPVSPIPIRAGDVIKMRDGSARGAYDQELVRLEGTVLEDYKQDDQHVWILRQDDTVFEARLTVARSTGGQVPIAVGSVVSLTGICTIHAGPRLNPTSFTVLLRSPGDLVVLKRGPWWTPTRTYSVLAGLLGLTACVLLWVAALRSRVERQTRTIRESEARFRYLSEHDELTGLLNRRAVLQELDSQLARGSREQKSVTIILGDIDHFKKVNDVHGHLAGDAALRRFAEAIKGCIRSYDSAGRYGGEEFLMVLVGVAEESVEERLETLHLSISNLTVRIEETEFLMTCSLGAVTIRADHLVVERDQLLAAADGALYEAKRAGRNRVVMHRGAPLSLLALADG